jgi:tetraacyldisaccharide 4'-kinase
MKERLAELEQWGSDVIFGRARGFRASLMRLLMLALSWIYRLAVRVRLALFRSGWKERRHLGTLVVAVGNITVGGTGKTPVVELLARSLRDRGRRVAILSRGYKSRRLDRPQEWRTADGGLLPAEVMPKVVSTGKEVLLDSKFAGDEPFMLARNLDGVAVVVDRDRVKGGRFAIGQLGADTLILDDGMQYLRLAHAIDIVLVDAREPFGTGSLLPRGTLREPPANLRRASYILITKCDGQSNETLVSRLRQFNPTAGIIECTHGPIRLENPFTGETQPLALLQDRWVAALSGIAVPENFERLLEQLGARVEIRRRFPDHHRFARREIERFIQRCIERDLEMIITTEKDAVRLPRPRQLDMPVFFLRVEVTILKGAEVWNDMVERLSSPPATREHLLRHREAYRP